MNNEAKNQLKGRLVPIYEFVIHLAIGLVIFVVIAGFAVGIGALIEWMDIRDDVIRTVLVKIKYIIFGTDCLLFGVFLLSSTIHTSKKLWKH